MKTLAEEKHLPVTLADEARSGVEETVRSGFLDWLHQFSLVGEDGEVYFVGGAILSLAQEQLDVVTMNWTKGKGHARQLPNSIYRLGEYPGKAPWQQMYREAKGTLQIDIQEDRVVVTCGSAYKVTCFADHRWLLELQSKDGSYSAELWHIPQGNPLWYGKTVPSALTQHSITYGYNWAGDVKGWICLEKGGKHIAVEGRGIRERYVAVDSSAAELGAWEDWGWIAFDEMHASLYDMRAGMKDFSLYDLTTEKHYASDGKLRGGNHEGDTMNIYHSDWLFLRELDGFVPENYRIHIVTEDGELNATAHVCNAVTWGVTFKVPDNPAVTLMFDRVEGTFTRKDGTVMPLHNGAGTMSVRQWHAYPNILPRELYCDTQLTGEKFETL